MKKNYFLLITLFILTGCLPKSADVNLKSDNQIDRYQIVKMNEYRAYLVDTVTGDTWVWTTIVDDKAKTAAERELADVWKPVNRFNTSADFYNYASTLWSNAENSRNQKESAP